MGTTPARTSPFARGPPPLHMAFLPPRRVNLETLIFAGSGPTAPSGSGLAKSSRWLAKTRIYVDQPATWLLLSPPWRLCFLRLPSPMGSYRAHGGTCVSSSELSSPEEQLVAAVALPPTTALGSMVLHDPEEATNASLETPAEAHFSQRQLWPRSSVSSLRCDMPFSVVQSSGQASPSLQPSGTAKRIAKVAVASH